MGSGFDNDVMYADNVDFTGGSPVSGKVTANGQLLIGSAVSPNIRVNTLTAGTGVTITNGAGTITISSADLHTARFIVGIIAQGANYTTIASALTAASSGDTIYIQTGTYTENLTLKAGVNLCAFECDSQTPNVTIVGNATATFAGTCTLSGLRLQTNGAALLTVSGSAATKVIFSSCFLNITNSTGIVMSSSDTGAEVRLLYCEANLTTTGIAYFTMANGNMRIRHCTLGNSGVSVTASTAANASAISIQHSTFSTTITTSDTSSLGITHSSLPIGTATITVNGTGTNIIHTSRFETNTNSTFSVGAGAALTLVDCNIISSNTNAITGAGTIRWVGVNFFGSSSKINTTTQTPLTKSNDAFSIVAPGAYPYAVLPGDAVIIVDTSAARSLTLSASPATGQTHRIKDNVGTAGTFNITITPAAGNIDGAASYIINTNYGAVDLVYNGTQWNVVATKWDSSSASSEWAVITADQSAAVNKGYICNKGSALVLTLPTTAAIGDKIRVTGINTALGWKIAQNANQQIFFGTSSTTAGVTGFIQSSAIRDSIEIICVVAGSSTVYNVLSSVGNLTVN